jgi:ketosteroid isomerase-like protein
MRTQSFGPRSVAFALVIAGTVSAVPCASGDAHHAVASAVATVATAAPPDVDPAAAAAIAVVERFSAALAAGQIDQAAAQLDPAVIVLESGGVEQSRDEYLASHAQADADFLKDAQVTLKRRRAQASGDLAWVASQSRILVKANAADALTIDSTETMVLRKAGGDWTIVHIHWSSRRADATSGDVPVAAAAN